MKTESKKNYEIASELLAKYEVKDLESVLKIMGSKSPYLKQPRVTKSGNLISLSKSGQSAYDDLIYIIFSLENIGALKNANEIVDRIDRILEKECNS